MPSSMPWVYGKLYSESEVVPTPLILVNGVLHFVTTFLVSEFYQLDVQHIYLQPTAIIINCIRRFATADTFSHHPMITALAKRQSQPSERPKSDIQVAQSLKCTKSSEID